MSHVLHDLHAEFPDDGDTLHELKVSNRHFQTVSDRYHDVNKEIHRIEAEVEAASDERSERLKKQRLLILDEVAAMISKAKAA
ncbi:YdcH family protein [Parasphingorhabdus sp.]|uniref:YdcH family protein n=1 Tax=Parasphingorhabdus sp. TaxID=2709688 RepID=UPI0030015269